MKRKKQKLFGLLAVVLSLVIFYLTATATLQEDKDCSMGLMMLGLGIYTMVTKQDVFGR